MDNEKKLKIIDVRDIAGVLDVATVRPIDASKRKKSINLARGGIVDFTEKEIKTMPKIFKRLLILQKKRCRLRTRQSGKNSITYEIRYRRDGYDVHACGKTLELAKANFLEKLKTAQPVAEKTGGGCAFPETFTAFALYYFENFRREKIVDASYRLDLSRLKNHLSPRFKEKPIKKITPPECKNILDEVRATGKSKTALELHSLLSIIFKGAIAHGIITQNPMTTVFKAKHESKHGKALSKSDEITLLNALKGSIYETATALALFCGLRPNELKTAQIQGDFIQARNSKRKGGKIEYKKIPIINRLRPFLPADGVFYIPHLDALREQIRNVLPAHKLYDLRTTFYTRCDEMGVAPPARDYFVGHSSGVLTNTYRDLSDAYLLQEAEKLNLW